jgi:hypothetical protein
MLCPDGQAPGVAKEGKVFPKSTFVFDPSIELLSLGALSAAFERLRYFRSDARIEGQAILVLI